MSSHAVNSHSLALAPEGVISRVQQEVQQHHPSLNVEPVILKCQIHGYSVKSLFTIRSQKSLIPGPCHTWTFADELSFVASSFIRHCQGNRCRCDENHTEIQQRLSFFQLNLSQDEISPESQNLCQKCPSMETRSKCTLSKFLKCCIFICVKLQYLYSART